LQRCGVEEILHEVLMKHRLGGSPRAGVSLFPGYRHGDHPLFSSLTAKLRASVSRLLARIRSRLRRSSPRFRLLWSHG
jgi:hypothetical protein